MSATDRLSDSGFGTDLVPAASESRFPSYRIGLALLVCAGYYFGARLGLALTFEPLPISVLWPPNAILFAALLLVPTRDWWIVLAAALPAHLASELSAGIPLTMAVCWYVSNLSEATIGAILFRGAIGDGKPFDSTRNVIYFFGAAIAAAIASSLIDAAFVRLNEFGPTAYWDLWRTRVVSNLVADAVIAVAVLGAVPALMRPLPRIDMHRFAEAVALTTFLAVISIVVFDTNVATRASAAQIYLPVPFLLWAAFRFGATGAGLSFAGVMLIAIWGAGHGVGALGKGSPHENVQSLQLLALCLGPTLLCLSIAIEDRNRAGRALRESNTRLRLVLEATRDTVYERDLATGAMRWSHNGPLNLGYEGEESLHGFRQLVDAIHPDDRPRALEAQEHAISGGRRKWETEYRLRRADGTYAHVLESGFLVCAGNGRPLEILVRLIDITERRTTEELNLRLAQASRVTAMGELAASIAHEINQPVGAILSNVDAAEILLDQGHLESDQMRAVLADIRSDNLRASEIVKHMRSLSRKRNLEIESFDLNALTEAMVRLAAPRARTLGFLLVTELGELPNAVADKVHVQQVLLNLLFNAMDAMSEAPRRSRIIVTTSCEANGMVRVAVRDRGTGIDSAQAERIFDLFFTTKAEGLGIGLSIARSLVNANGGRLGAQNNPDGGATFAFTLPTHRPS